MPTEFVGKMVECGSCDARFRVTDEVMGRIKRFYPGENRDPRLERFSRVPMKSGPMPQFQAAPAMANPEVSRPIRTFSPLRLMLGIASGIFILLIGMILVVGGEPGRLLDGASMAKRLILAGFGGLIGTILLIVANPWAKKKGLAGGLVATLLLSVLPFLFKTGLPDAERTPSAAAPTPFVPVDPASGDPLAALKEEMTYSKLGEAIENYGPTGQKDGVSAVGVWLRDVREYNKDLIVKYLIRQTHAGDKSWAYSRPPSDYLVVLHDVAPDLKALARTCQAFGQVGRTIDELQVVEVKVDNERFVAGPIDKLTNPEDPSFYELNRRELESIDSTRVEQAVRRLSNAPPTQYRTDISRRLSELLENADADLAENLSEALMKWSEPGDGAAEAVHAAAKRIARAKKEVPRPMIEFLVAVKDERAIDFIQELWLKKPRDWEALYGDMGPSIEASVISALPGDSLLLRMSAIRLLGRVGSARSLPTLQSMKSESEGEILVQINQAIAEIQGRQ
ncbi:hypothetical protein HNR46_003651 [Haloferula luteola]|uniref:Uncharacterized protein n=1 Tax=Haloferula luteola TaxID=595692 RepID=A0A840VCZ7_9BACT|nr:hypothetical protein [Haloferula luteola]MBB5353394.1 hypothetical protein [Haloferula luteola]